MSPKALTNIGFLLMVVGMVVSMAGPGWGFVTLGVGFVVVIAGRMSADA